MALFESGPCRGANKASGDLFGKSTAEVGSLHVTSKVNPMDQGACLSRRATLHPKLCVETWIPSQGHLPFAYEAVTFSSGFKASLSLELVCPIENFGTWR